VIVITAHHEAGVQLRRMPHIQAQTVGWHITPGAASKRFVERASQLTHVKISPLTFVQPGCATLQACCVATHQHKISSPERPYRYKRCASSLPQTIALGAAPRRGCKCLHARLQRAWLRNSRLAPGVRYGAVGVGAA
jgi:hypothetical protein